VPTKLNVITGATGLLGSHIAEALAARGERVRAVTRSSKNVVFLQQGGVELVHADLLDAASLRPALAGADIVYHCAARVGNWGSWRQFQADVVDTTRNLLAACAAVGVGRVLHVSSLSAYGHPRLPPSGEITEDEPLGQRLGFLDYYCRAKEQAERLAREYAGDVTIVRPSWIFGPRDRNGFPRLAQALRDGWVSLVGDGDNLLNIVYATDVAEGAISAANRPGGRGQAYNLSSEGAITQRQFFDCLTDGLGLPRIRRRVSARLAHWGGLFGEVVGRVFHWQRSPHVTRYGTGLLTRSTRYSIAKARAEFGWQPATSPQEGLERTLKWFHEVTRTGVG
jgi:nucleoside-diphosphate-sugar epimerase